MTSGEGERLLGRECCPGAACRSAGVRPHWVRNRHDTTPSVASKRFVNGDPKLTHPVHISLGDWAQKHNVR
jgi:hypothetical protein